MRSASMFSGGHHDDVDYISWNPTHPDLFCTSSQKDRRIVFWDARRTHSSKLHVMSTHFIILKRVDISSNYPWRHLQPRHATPQMVERSSIPQPESSCGTSHIVPKLTIQKSIGTSQVGILYDLASLFSVTSHNLHSHSLGSSINCNIQSRRGRDHPHAFAGAYNTDIVIPFDECNT